MSLHFNHRSLRGMVIGFVLVAGPLVAYDSDAATATIVGTPHLSSLEPAATTSQTQTVVDRLAAFEPTVVCVEAMPGERVEQFARDPNRHGELLSHFGSTAVQLAPEQQIRLGVDRLAARAAAGELERQDPPLDTDDRLRLIALQLAAYEPWSALLNWSYLEDAGRSAADETLGQAAAGRLERLAESNNEIARLAVPLARRFGHRRLCAVDSFVDEVAVQSLAEELMPIIRDADVQSGIQAFAAERGERWIPDRAGGLLELMAWMNSADWASRDLATQWDVFDSDAHDGASRRLMLWHARNAEILSWLFRAVSEADGERPLLLIGAAHRPFIEQALDAHRWMDVVPARSFIGAD